jgi:arginyl-tRNA synthetase
VKDLLKGLVEEALVRARDAGVLPIEKIPEPFVEVPRDRSHGDLSTNIALSLAKAARMAPRAIAEVLIAHMPDDEDLVSKVEIAGPGFINFTFSAAAWRGRLLEILAAGDDYGSSTVGAGKRVQVEFVSANPTGPLHIGHGRGAAVGDALARVLEAAGYEVFREYYVNDAGNQMEILGRSVLARYRELLGQDVEFPAEGYPGDYVIDLAREFVDRDGDKWLAAPEDEALKVLGERAGTAMLARIRSDLEAFSIRFDRFTSERRLRDDGTVAQGIEELRAKQRLYEKDGALWFRSTDFGDDKDRAVIKSNGDLTYFASDIAYHRGKFLEGYNQVVDVWGADHHGYIKRIDAALEALGHDPAQFKVVLVQIVNLTRDGVPVRMGKRKGEFVALRDVIDEVGPDLARFFFLMRSADAQLDFDLELARRQTAENPVFYVQYAHTRIAGIFRAAAERDIVVGEADEAMLAGLDGDDEVALIKVLAEFPDIVAAAADAYEPHRVVYYAQKLAGEFHRFYARHRCVTDDVDQTRRRLVLVGAVKQVIGRALRLVGVSAPERM